MKIGLQTWGSDGDIRPIIALAGGLRKAGHEVTLSVASVDGKDYNALAGSLGFRIIHAPMPPGQDMLKSVNEIENLVDPLKQVKVLMENHFVPYLDGMYETAVEMAGECDLLVGHHLSGSLRAAADKTGRPYVPVFLCHSFIPSRNTAPHPFPPMGKFLNGLLWKAANALVAPVITAHFNRLREKHGIAPLDDLFFTGWKSRELSLVAVSRHICESRPDWDESVQVCGFFDVPVSAEEWSPPPDLREFLENGEPPVYFTFGSMTQFKPQEITGLMAKAAAFSGKRAIIQSHWDRVASVPESRDVFRMTKAPHHNIFPHCALVVHHGGAGTSHSATYCGLPSVVVAHAFDQEFWGSELKRMGIGGKTLDIRNVTPERLGAEIRRMCGSAEAREKARVFGESLRSENGVSRAVSVIEKRYGKVRRHG